MEDYEDEKTILKGSAFQFVSSIILRITSFIYTIILGRMFLQQEVGAFFLSFNIILFLTIFADLGLSNSFLRYVPYYLEKKDKQKINLLTKNTPFFVILLTFVSSLTVYFFSRDIAYFFNEPQLENLIRLFSFYLFFNEILSLLKVHFLNFKKFKEALIYENLQNILKIALTLILANCFGANSEILVYAFLISILLTLAIFVFFDFKNIGSIFKLNMLSKENLETVKEIMPYGLLMSLLSLLLFILYYINIFLLGFLLPSNLSMKSIAIYSIVFALSNTIILFANSAKALLITTISGKFGKEDQLNKIPEISERITKFIALSFFPIASFMLIFPEKVLSLLYGYEYTSGSLILLILICSLMVLYLSFIQRTILENTNKLNEVILIFLFGCASNIILGIAMIPKYSINGAAIASFISYLLITLCIQFFSKESVGYKITLGFLFKYIFAFGLGLVPLYLVKLNFLDEISFLNPNLAYIFVLFLGSYFISLVTFFSVLYFFGFFNKGDFHVFKSALLKLKKDSSSFYQFLVKYIKRY